MPSMAITCLFVLRQVSSLVTGPRVEEAMHRSIRWLDRCIAVIMECTSDFAFPIDLDTGQCAP